MAGSDRARTDELYRTHRGAIARQIRALLQDDTAVDDLVNETFLRAHRSLQHFDGRSSIGTWLHGIAINVTRTHLHKRLRRAGLDERHAAKVTPQLAAGPEEEIAAELALDRFRTAVRDLPDALREAFVLRVLEQRPWQEVAEQLEVAMSTLHGRVARAEAIVRARMEGT